MRETKRVHCPFCSGLRVFFKAVHPDDPARWLWVCYVCRQHERTVS
ncbi:hypothetical protein UFOVP998_51 [uncultured Caudovirales phage]|uniref:Uncharacterized protein n=1 Tax=uncultured Caudovirales phage TaxID=2100421 RepID=A0A6J5RPF1_9CAUD|nr:hypothetical protein UFOVP998_51 [uncultured Caudovirales phage]CAB4198959.1 hypothetical protein UFOVP1331_8 [uncultured Caudovirales phage]CAB4212474.1 hypothetical protein UFOVP1442_5 [uncultured Caudovirales phage]CAB5228087.1 hypothetical protein UFOVP1535_46 [uncultured Caudovirales phage]